MSATENGESGSFSKMLDPYKCPTCQQKPCYCLTIVEGPFVGVDQARFPSQEQTLAWVAEKWPDRTDPIWRAGKLCEEAGEVMGAVIKMDEGRKTLDDLRMELAQVVICAMALAESAGIGLFPAVQAEYLRVVEYDGQDQP